VLRIHGLTVVVLVQGRGKMAFLPAITAVLVLHSGMNTWNRYSDVITVYRGNGVSAWSYCRTVTSLYNEQSSRLYHNKNSLPINIHHNLRLETIYQLFIFNVVLILSYVLGINLNFHFRSSHNFIILYYRQSKSCW
jgi:hypothetical protein